MKGERARQETVAAARSVTRSGGRAEFGPDSTQGQRQVGRRHRHRVRQPGREIRHGYDGWELRTNEARRYRACDQAGRSADDAQMGGVTQVIPANVSARAVATRGDDDRAQQGLTEHGRRRPGGLLRQLSPATKKGPATSEGGAGPQAAILARRSRGPTSGARCGTSRGTADARLRTDDETSSAPVWLRMPLARFTRSGARGNDSSTPHSLTRP